jgi:ABC-type nickel/cobalt efflux system permease component RcnA
MASFIIAIRGSIAQAVLLGLCAALSHSLVVWLLAAAALHFGNQLLVEQAEPWLLLLSGLIVLGIAGWMFWRTRLDNLAARGWQQARTAARSSIPDMAWWSCCWTRTAHASVVLLHPAHAAAATGQRYAPCAATRRDDGSEESHLLQLQEITCNRPKR